MDKQKRKLVVVVVAVVVVPVLIWVYFQMFHDLVSGAIQEFERSRLENALEHSLSIDYCDHSDTPATIVNKLVLNIVNNRAFNDRQREGILTWIHLKAWGFGMHFCNFENDIKDTPRSALIFAGIHYHLDISPVEAMQIMFMPPWIADRSYEYELIDEYIDGPIRRGEDNSQRQQFERRILEKLPEFFDSDTPNWVLSNPYHNEEFIAAIEDALEVVLEERFGK